MHRRNEGLLLNKNMPSFASNSELPSFNPPSSRHLHNPFGHPNPLNQKNSLRGEEGIGLKDDENLVQKSTNRLIKEYRRYSISPQNKKVVAGSSDQEEMVQDYSQNDLSTALDMPMFPSINELHPKVDQNLKKSFVRSNKLKKPCLSMRKSKDKNQNNNNGQRSKNRYKQNSIMSDFTDSNIKSISKHDPTERRNERIQPKRRKNFHSSLIDIK